MKSQQKLFSRYTRDIKPGQLTWIGLRPARKEPMEEVTTVMALEGKGLEGDHRCTKTVGSARQITIISEEYIQQISHFLGGKEVLPAALRRNLVVRNINLSAIRYQQFIIGDAVFEATALCHPCSRMEKTLGKGGLSAMLGHGGLCAKIIRSGTINIGDAITLNNDQRELF